jgi:hypothetical protein
LHVAIAQLPCTHAAVAFGRTQTWPHVPQLFGSVLVLVSHPLAQLPSQSKKPGLHPPQLHMPEMHWGVAFGMEQTTPQAPQLPMSVVVFVSQPFAGFLSQSA